MTSSHAKPSPRLRRWQKILLAIVAAIAAVALLLGGTYFWLYSQGRNALFGDRGSLETPESLVEKVEDDGLTVEYGGMRYRYNEAVVSVLFIGVDKSDVQQNSGYGQNGQADTLFLAALDTKTGTVRIIPLPREAMVDVNIIGVGGGFAGTQRTQLCLAYAYGATGAESCENTARSVSRLLYGAPVDAYCAIDLQGVRVLTDAVGGVPVTVQESFKATRHRFVKGETVTLKGAMADDYIRYRSNDLDGSTKRMKRQKQFLQAFFQTARRQLSKDFSLLTTYYSAAKPYLISDLGLSEITYLVSNGLLGTGVNGFEYLSIDGQMALGQEFAEFIPDPTSAYETVLAAFYTKVTD